MSETQPALSGGSPRRLGRSIGAVLAGIVVGIILTLGMDMILHAARVFPPLGQPVGDMPLVLATVYRAIFGVVAAYVTARLAPHGPVGHALIGGLIGVIVTTVGAVATWNRGPAFGPHWYPVALIVLTLPTAWLGGKLRVRQLRTPQPL